MSWGRMGSERIALTLAILPEAVSACYERGFVGRLIVDTGFLVALYIRIGERVILTVDETDFSIYRLKGNRRFDVVPWY
jgi:NADH:ubiquinone oxidoreductase subunit F (NADH-binding)